ncbi:ABC transporter ATP-binding protein [Tritonibacter horizontis]|uniref:Putative siderophore transport system ATP-binding protein YusV n=1 Tax=Tritonibacter horizontis TaxID=1768241 RepID=A0A132BSW1_9RHOB|nr:ABC transporter ATP-binding protein [Tritonibacter horizontis]KUP91495.1 putative siderophore transport system ATP-binding protein YusV [Tritonibacter horizontis]
MPPHTRLSAQELSVNFADTQVLDQLSVSVPDGAVTAIVGPNACGKSTLLRSLARLQQASAGQVILDGKAIAAQNSKSVARRLAILPQSPLAPEGLSVRDLVLRGRTPHQSAWRQYSAKDATAVATAIAATGLEGLEDRSLHTLSGGQRQRAWIAMALAQETQLVLLDEPTTYLDLPHQIELLDLVRRLNRDTGRTVAMVLHDINLAARYCDHVIALRGGTVHSEGPPSSVITETMMGEVFNLPCTIIADPNHGTPHVIPS